MRAQMMEGSIAVKSVKGEFAEFTLRLPYRPSETASTSSFRKQQPADNVSLEKPVSSTEYKAELDDAQGHILVVDDTIAMRMLVAKMVEKLGFQVTTAENGAQAVEEALRNNFSLIIMDMQMPVMDGIEATRKLRNLRYSSPIVALSANTSQLNREQFLAAGADDFMEKPINGMVFKETVERYAQLTETMLHENSVKREFEAEPITDEMKAYFIERLAYSFRKLHTLMEQQDLSGMRYIIHEIKGSSADYGHPQLHSQAEKIYDALEQSDHDAVLAQLPVLLSSISVCLKSA